MFNVFLIEKQDVKSEILKEKTFFHTKSIFWSFNCKNGKKNQPKVNQNSKLTVKWTNLSYFEQYLCMETKSCQRSYSSNKLKVTQLFYFSSDFHRICFKSCTRLWSTRSRWFELFLQNFTTSKSGSKF